MDISDSLRVTRRVALGLAAAACIAASARAQATAVATCSVRVRSSAALDYDPSAEVLLQGRLMGREDGLILLRLTAGTVRVETGAWDGTTLGGVGSLVKVLASRSQKEGRQRFLARLVSRADGWVEVRDARGVPVSRDSQP